MLRMIGRLCFSSTRRLLITVIVLALCAIFPVIPLTLARGLGNIIMPIAVPIGLLLIVGYGLQTMFGVKIGGGRRRK